MPLAVGIIWCSSSNRFGPICTFNWLTPVRFPSGRFRLLTSPSETGSFPEMKTIGIVEVAALTTGAAAAFATITVTR
jgi:hypothetical protein